MEINHIAIALLLGTIAGLIDALPMIKMQVPRFSIWYVFAQWVFIGLLIPFVNWPFAGWLKGLIIGVLGMIPVAIIACHRNKKRVPAILLFAAILGAAIGYTSSIFID